MRINAAREQIAHGNMAAVFSLQKNFCKKWNVLSTYSGAQCIKSCLWLNDNKSLFWILVKTQKYISKFHNNYFSFDETVSLPSYFYLLASFINLIQKLRVNRGDKMNFLIELKPFFCNFCCSTKIFHYICT